MAFVQIAHILALTLLSSFQIVWPLLMRLAKKMNHNKIDNEICIFGKSTCHLDMGSVIVIVIEQSQIMLMIDWKFKIAIRF